MERMDADELVCAAVPGRERGGNCSFPESASGQKGAGGSVLFPERAAVESGWKLETADKRTVSRICLSAERTSRAFVKGIGGIPPDRPDHGRTGVSDFRLSGGGGVPARAMRAGSPPVSVLRLQRPGDGMFQNHKGAFGRTGKSGKDL